MGKRGPKPQFTDVACPNEDCNLYGQTGQENVVGNGTYISRGEKTRRVTRTIIESLESIQKVRSTC